MYKVASRFNGLSVLGKLLLSAIAGTVALSASAEDYPSRPITLVVPFSAGGSTDIQARIVAKGLTEKLHQTVIVENKPGAAGEIGANFVAHANPDGYTILFASISSLVVEPIVNRQAGFDPLKNFAPVSIATDMPFLMVVNCDKGVKDLNQLISGAKAKPGVLNYSSWGYGSAGNLLAEMFKLSTNLDIAHIPFKGESPALMSLLAGDVTTMFTTPVNMPYITSHRICPLAVTGAQRLTKLPDVKTFSEQGVKGMDLNIWFGIVAPAKTPAPIVAKLQSAVVDVVKSPAFTRAIDPLGVTAVGSTPAAFVTRIQSDQALITSINEHGHIKE
ncbi:Bug family tripartite tricarboxylate transporter substrate binding protein [Paraburkholderia antibiotica]|uniref:Tripartite tricarboxylate transporter substrate binding protein n=1 Tax=Paraburkholderia antibiotica TaxID=2728839 RepID=A0A7X9ZYJ2_9BURK|nr:tripartite tricarboxylate transporter substrate binding protein [Paraburkholderia antibiotica]NML32871.1 tripartite tricarboxylate transporter substrate binding protein [Paraburkholderia antibiotica]